ncbi:MAG: FMN-binding protein [Planctomycetes bacterium]|nr:FMN-binding protein [Planctomycetota bacterium]
MIGYVRQASLVLILSLVIGVTLAAVNDKLAPRIKANELQAREDAALEVVPGAAKAEQVSLKLTSIDSKPKQPITSEIDVYRVVDENGKQVGWAVPAQGPGYADTIKLTVGLTPDAKRITDFKVIYNQETPGLGNKITGKAFRSHFAGKTTAKELLAVKQTTDLGEDEVQAITGATISSQAVCDIIYKQLAQTGLTEKLAAASREGIDENGK